MSVSETVASFNVTAANGDDDSESTQWKRTLDGVAQKQKEDEAIAQVIFWAVTCDETIDMPSLGTNFIPKEQAIQYGPKTLAYWSRWDEWKTLQEGVSARWLQANYSDESSGGETAENS